MKILIVGGGLGGLALAGFLKDSNVEYEIVEKSANWDHQGYSLSIWQNGRNILKKLGLAETFDKSGKQIQNYYIYDGKGKPLREYSLKDFYSRYGMSLTLTSRKDLHEWLMRKVDPSKIKMATSVAGIIKNGYKTKVIFTDNRSELYDLVIGADGIHSMVRELVFKGHTIHKSKWRVWYMWVDNKYRIEGAVSEYIEAGQYIALFDCGEKTLAIIVAEHKGVLWDDAETRIERLKSTFKNITALTPQIFESLKAADINPVDLVDIKLKTWTKGGVTLLGDAAHGFGPYSGVGGSMALEDGYVLATELMKVSETYTLSSALKNYEKKRRPRVDVARRLSTNMKRWSLISSKTIRRAVDLFVPYFPEKFLVKDYFRLFDEEI